MEIEEIKNLIFEVINSDKKIDDNVKLLIFNNSDDYSFNKFLLEATQIAKESKIKILVYDNKESTLQLENIPNVVKVYYNNSHINMKELFKNVDAVILGVLSLGLASKIVSLNITDEIDNAISYSLINNINIIATYPIEHESVKNKEYLKHIIKIEEELKALNINFLKLDDIKSYINKSELISGKKLNESKVITEDIIKKFQGKTLKISNNTVVTPLANDVAKEKKIIITRGN